jgi:hypothetical protein
MIIDAAEPKSEYLRRMEKFYQARANKRRERDLHVRIKEMKLTWEKLKWMKNKKRLNNVKKL